MPLDADIRFRSGKNRSSEGSAADRQGVAMIDIYTAKHCHDVAVEIDGSTWRYFDRLCAAADTLCYVQDGIASIPLDLVKGHSLYPVGKKFTGEPESTPHQMVEHIVREAFAGTYYLDGQWSTTHSTAPARKLIMQDYRPSETLMADLILTGRNALEQLTEQTITRLTDAFDPPVVPNGNVHSAKNGAVR